MSTGTPLTILKYIVAGSSILQRRFLHACPGTDPEGAQSVLLLAIARCLLESGHEFRLEERSNSWFTTAAPRTR